MTKKTLIENLDLSEVSLVDKGANPGALITLFKRADEGDDGMSIGLEIQIQKSQLALSKGGDHDQKTHGNRGGRKSSLKEEIFGQKTVAGLKVKYGKDPLISERDKFFVDIDGDVSYHDSRVKAQAKFNSSIKRLKA